MPKYWICASILSADIARLGEEVDKALAAGADRIHVDVMDNHYVPNLTFGPLIVKALRKYGVKAPIDVHLMVEPVDMLIERFSEAGSSCIVFHPEASRHVDRSLSLIRSLGCEAGLALNPATSLAHLSYVLDKLDRILLMSVNPGFGGQRFIPSMLDKVKQTKSLIDQHQGSIRLEIDGGVKAENIAEIAKAGVDTFVVGSGLFEQPNYQDAIAKMRQNLNVKLGR